MPSESMRAGSTTETLAGSDDKGKENRHMTDSIREATRRYLNKITRVQVNLNPDKDADILAVLNMDENLATQLKQLIREAVTVRNALGKK